MNSMKIPAQLEYSMTFPSELRTGSFNPTSNNWRTDLLFPRFEILGPRNRRSENGGIPPGYYQEGFLAIQNAIARQFLEMKSNQNAVMPEIFIQVLNILLILFRFEMDSNFRVFF